MAVQLSLPLWQRDTTDRLTRLEDGQAELRGMLTLVITTQVRHSEVLDLLLPADVKANPAKLAVAREHLEQVERRAS